MNTLAKVEVNAVVPVSEREINAVHAVALAGNVALDAVDTFPHANRREFQYLRPEVFPPALVNGNGKVEMVNTSAFTMSPAVLAVAKMDADGEAVTITANVNDRLFRKFAKIEKRIQENSRLGAARRRFQSLSK